MENTMPQLKELEHAMPVAPLKLIALNSATSLGNSINRYLVDYRKNVNNSFKNDPAFQGYVSDNYLLHAECPRFGSGEAKGILRESGGINLTEVTVLGLIRCRLTDIVKSCPDKLA